MGTFHRAHVLSTVFDLQIQWTLCAQCASAEGALIRPTSSQPFS